MIEGVYHLEDGALVLHPERHECRAGFSRGAGTDDRRHAGTSGARRLCGDAWDAERIVGVAVLDNTPLGPQGDQLQLRLLHVSRDYRDQGVGGRLVEVARIEARRLGARDLYVSATPSEHTVRFYLARGCRLNPHPDPDLYAEEPEDIHLLCQVW